MPILKGLVKGRFSILLIALALLFLVVPLLPVDHELGRKIFDGSVLIVLVSCLRAVAVSRRYFIFLVALSLINVSIGSTAIISGQETGVFISIVQLFKIVYGLLIFCSIMHYVLDQSPATSDKICGAISAYFLMGFMWSQGFMLFFHLDPASINVPAEMLGNKIWSIYFSFTTLTTLGYGDITPQTTATRAYAILEAAVGQIFLAVIIARLVALQLIHGSQQK